MCTCLRHSDNVLSSFALTAADGRLWIEKQDEYIKITPGDKSHAGPDGMHCVIHIGLNVNPL